MEKWLGSSGEAKESGGLKMLLNLLDLNIKAFLPQVAWKSLSKRAIPGTWVRFPPCFKLGFCLWIKAWTLNLDWMHLISDTVFTQKKTTFLALWRGIKVYLDHTLLNLCSLPQSIYWTHSDLISSWILYVSTSTANCPPLSILLSITGKPEFHLPWSELSSATLPYFWKSANKTILQVCKTLAFGLIWVLPKSKQTCHQCHSDKSNNGTIFSNDRPWNSSFAHCLCKYSFF